MSALIAVFFTTSAPIMALAIAALWLARRPSSAAARRFVQVAAACYFIVSLPIVPSAIGRVFTVGYHPFKAEDIISGRATAIVLLGAGDELIEGWSDRMTAMTRTESARVLEASRVFRLVAPQWIISSGGKSDSLDPSDPSSVAMRDALVRLGVPRRCILLESSSLNTYDEAVLVAPMLASLGIQQVVLVTSDTHMRRSLGAFRTVGVNAVPAIAPDPRLSIRWFWWILPSHDGLELSGAVSRELLGIPYYWLRGRWR